MNDPIYEIYLKDADAGIVDVPFINYKAGYLSALKMLRQGSTTLPEEFEVFAEDEPNAIIHGYTKEQLTTYGDQREASGIEKGKALALVELRTGGVELPKPMYTTRRQAYGDSFSERQMNDYGDQREASGIEKGKALALAELRAGGVELPSVNLSNPVAGEVMSLSKELVDWFYAECLTYGDRRAAAAVPWELIEAIEALLSNEEHAFSGGMRSYQVGSQTWELWEAVRKAMPQPPKEAP